MNDKFYTLPKEKQQRIINAGYHVFAYNSYKKSPVSEIAEAAGISKSLLFYYFHNKKELYLFLWDEVAKLTIESLHARYCYAPSDLFEMMYLGMEAKLDIMRVYPDIAAFSMRAFYEKDPEVIMEVQNSYSKISRQSIHSALSKIDTSIFRPGLDIEMIFKEMFWASEGYMWEVTQRGHMDIHALERDFRKLLDFWKCAYCKDEIQRKEPL